MTVVAVFAILGYGFAQETHWPEFNLYQYMFNLPVVCFVQVDGEYVTVDNYADMEVAPFVNGECRGHQFMDDYTGDGDPYPIIDGVSVYYTTAGEPVTFQLYDHATNTLYEGCTAFVKGTGEVIPLYTGDDHVELYFDYETAVVLNFFVLPTFEKEIEGYGDPETNPNGNYYLIASPIGDVAAANVENLMVNNYDFFSFDPTVAEQEWVNHRGEEDYTLATGMGYLYANSEDVTLYFTGLPITDEEFGVELVYDESVTTMWKGYNLIGNPFAEEAMIVEEGRDYYRMVNGAFVPGDDGMVEAMEGILVQAEGADEVVTFAPATGGSSIVPGDKKVVMNVTAGRALADRAIIRFGEGRQLSKIQFNSNSTKLYIPQDGEDYAVVRAAEMGEMPVNFKAEKNGTYMLSFTTSNVEFGYLHLIDNLTGADVDLLVNPSYSFEANTTDYASRFKLVFATGENEESFAFYSNGSFVISNEGEATLQVVDVTGRILSSESISGCANVNVKAAAGVYMLRLINGDNVKVQKVVVK